MNIKIMVGLVLSCLGMNGVFAQMKGDLNPSAVNEKLGATDTNPRRPESSKDGSHSSKKKRRSPEDIEQLRKADLDKQKPAGGIGGSL